MFDIGWSELLLIGAVALIVVGPRDLPKLMRGAASWVRAARRMAGAFQRQVDDLMADTELDDLRREVSALRTGQPLMTPRDTRLPPKAGDGAAPEAPAPNPRPAGEGQAPVVSRPELPPQDMLS
jgi:sec-independent protein translocase protein TatB